MTDTPAIPPVIECPKCGLVGTEGVLDCHVCIVDAPDIDDIRLADDGSGFPAQDHLTPATPDRARSSAAERVTEYKQYRRTQIAEMADWTSGFDMSGVSISEPDRQNGSPKVGDKIARNPANHADRWLVAAAYFAANFGQVTAAPVSGDARERATAIVEAFNDGELLTSEEEIGLIDDIAAALTAERAGGKIMRLYQSDKGIWRYDIERDGKTYWSSLHTRDEATARERVKRAAIPKR